MSAFEIAWRERHPGCDPIGYRLRAAGSPNWVRFHSLPLSKRYAQTDEEWRILLHRQNILANAVLGDGVACWLAQACWRLRGGTIDFADTHDSFRATREHSLAFAFSFLEDDEDEDASPWDANAAIVTWNEGRFDALLRDIADERAAPTLWMSADTGSVFAPYDGGVDLFLADRSMVETLSARHSEWLSPHPSGL